MPRVLRRLGCCACRAFRLSVARHREPVGQRSGRHPAIWEPLVGTYRVFRRLLITFMAAASLAAIPLATAPQSRLRRVQSPAAGGLPMGLPPHGRATRTAGAAPGPAATTWLWGGDGRVFPGGHPLRPVHHRHARLGAALVRENPSVQARRGDLAFYGTGHVEFFVRPGPHVLVPWMPGPGSAGIRRTPGGIPRCSSGSGARADAGDPDPGRLTGAGCSAPPVRPRKRPGKPPPSFLKRPRGCGLARP